MNRNQTGAGVLALPSLAVVAAGPPVRPQVQEPHGQVTSPPHHIPDRLPAQAATTPLGCRALEKVNACRRGAEAAAKTQAVLERPCVCSPPITDTKTKELLSNYPLKGTL